MLPLTSLPQLALAEEMTECNREFGDEIVIVRGQEDYEFEYEGEPRRTSTATPSVQALKLTRCRARRPPKSRLMGELAAAALARRRAWLDFVSPP